MRELSTATVSDALDRLGIRGQCQELRPLAPSMRLYGPAFTVRMLPVGYPPGTVGDYIDEVPEGHVVVIDNRGDVGGTVWGDLLTAAALRRGIAGTVIDGASRDSERSRELGYPIFGRGVFMRTGKARVEIAGVGRRVAVGGVLVAPGDVVLGDADGVVVVPRDRLADVERAAREIEAAEESIRRSVEAGDRLAEARDRVGYHRLQGAS